MNQDLEQFGLSEEELFSRVDHSDLDAEKITAPRYSYWHSVFRVFFKKKINIVILALLAVILAFTYIYPLFVDYDKFGNLLNATAKHLSPSAAMKQFGANIHWILGAGAAGQSTFDAIWFGSRISISLALVCGLINITVGVIVGAIWGILQKSRQNHDGSLQRGCKRTIHPDCICYGYDFDSKLLDDGLCVDHHRMVNHCVLHPYTGNHHPRQRI